MVRFTQPIALNDPFEFLPAVLSYGDDDEIREIASVRLDDHLRKLFDEIADKNKWTFEAFLKLYEKRRNQDIEMAIKNISPSLNSKMSERINQYTSENIGVLSLSKNFNNLLMWPHYSSSHKGYVVEFDTETSFFNQQANKHLNRNEPERVQSEYGYPKEIRYLNDRPNVILSQQINMDMFFTKSSNWCYEEEYRMLMPLEFGIHSGIDDGGHDVWLFKIPEESITRIFLGSRCDIDVESKALNLKNHSETKHIKIEKASIDSMQFKLNFEEINY